MRVDSVRLNYKALNQGPGDTWPIPYRDRKGVGLHTWGKCMGGAGTDGGWLAIHSWEALVRASQGTPADRELGSSGAFSNQLRVGSAITCLLQEDSGKDGLKKGLGKKKRVLWCSHWIMVVSPTGGILMALQCCIGLCRTTVRNGHKHAYVPSLLNLLPIPLPYPSGFSLGLGLSSLCYIAAPY